MAEGAFREFISETHLGIWIGSCALAFVVILAIAGIVLPQESAHVVSISIIVADLCFGVPLLYLAFAHRRRFQQIFFGLVSLRRILLLGVALPVSIVLAWLALIESLSRNFHTPIRAYLDPSIHTEVTLLALPMFPFVEEMVFRAWLQTRLTQFFGILGAIAAGGAFLAIHLSLNESRIVPAVLFTFVRYRYRSLGTSIVMHYVFDIALVAVVFALCSKG